MLDFDALGMTTDGPSDAGFHFIQDFQRCEKYWGYKYYYGIEPLHDSRHVLYGHAMHVAMEKWYLLHDKGTATPVRVQQAKKAFIESMAQKEKRYFNHDEYEADKLRGLQTLEGYGLQYFNEYWRLATVQRQDTGQIIKAVEMPLRAVLPSGVHFTGRVDMAAYNREGRLYIIDHKNTGWVMYKLEKTLRASGQATGYLWLWNETFPNYRANAVVFNVLRNVNGNTEYKQIPVYKTQEDIDTFKKDVDIVLNRMLSIVDSPEPYFVRNTDQCTAFGAPCPYIKLCQGENFDVLLGRDFRLRGAPIHEEEQ